MSAEQLRRGCGEPLDKAPRRIAGMFDAIAARYDLLNLLLCAGLDRRWRRASDPLAAAHRRARRLLDVCTGTADVAIGAAPRRARRRARDRAWTSPRRCCGTVSTRSRRPGVARIPLIRGDAMALPVADQSVDALTIAFGIRNVQMTEAACGRCRGCCGRAAGWRSSSSDCRSVPGLGPLYGWYFRRVLPRIGRLISRHGGAYSYLPASVGAFPYGRGVRAILRLRPALSRSTSRPLTLGIVYLYSARRPDRDP